MQDSLMLMTTIGMEISIQNVVAMEQEHMVIRGRLAGTADMGRVFFVPYDQINYLGFQKEMKQSQIQALVGDGTGRRLRKRQRRQRTGLKLSLKSPSHFPNPRRNLNLWNRSRSRRKPQPQVHVFPFLRKPSSLSDSGLAAGPRRSQVQEREIAGTSAALYPQGYGNSDSHRSKEYPARRRFLHEPGVGLG